MGDFFAILLKSKSKFHMFLILEAIFGSFFTFGTGKNCWKM